MSQNNGISVSIEMGDGYRPNARIAAAVQELDDALQEAHGDNEVSGFGAFKVEIEGFLGGVFTSTLNAKWAPGAPLNRNALCTNENITE